MGAKSKLNVEFWAIELPPVSRAHEHAGFSLVILYILHRHVRRRSKLGSWLPGTNWSKHPDSQGGGIWV